MFLFLIQEKGSYAQEIYYETTIDNMEALINRSKACIQRLGYDCKGSSLMDSVSSILFNRDYDLSA